MKMKVKEDLVVSPDMDFKLKVREMLTKRNIEKKIPMLVWLRSQKQLKVDANLRRAEAARRQMTLLEEMVAEEEAKGEVSADGT
jgi:hypothetical protein